MVGKNNLSAKERLIAATIDNMWNKNFIPTGVEQLCQAAGVTRGSFYHFFTSKNELAIAAIERMWHDAEEQVFIPIFSSGTSNLGNKFRELVEKMKVMQSDCVANHGAAQGCPFGNLGQEMAVEDEAIRKTLERILTEKKNYFEGALVAAEAAGEIPCGNIKRKADSILALIQGTNLVARIYNDSSIFEGLENSILALATFSHSVVDQQTEVAKW